MTKYLMMLAALFALMACEGDGIKYTEDGWAIYAGLEWSPSAENYMEWQEAMDYCKTMGARLPNINELRKIIINCPGSAYGGACQVSDPDCLDSDCQKYEDCSCNGSADSYSALGDGNIYLWSSSSHASYTYSAWRVVFDLPVVVGYYVKNGPYGRVRCVR